METILLPPVIQLQRDNVAAPNSLDVRSFPDFRNWLGILIAGIEWRQSEVVFDRPQNAVVSIWFCDLSGLHHVSKENRIDSLRLVEQF